MSSKNEPPMDADEQRRGVRDRIYRMEKVLVGVFESSAMPPLFFWCRGQHHE
ncbi:MAG: hypothetical protein JXN60_08520 [Lentisphaerae bacterium]|nr:hypothetical protein [Lentisphaerota bacterium]